MLIDFQNALIEFQKHFPQGILALVLLSYGLFSFLSTAIVSWLPIFLSYRSFKKTKDEHWTERARAFYGFRTVPITLLVIVFITHIILIPSFIWPFGNVMTSLFVFVGILFGSLGVLMWSVGPMRTSTETGFWYFWQSTASLFLLIVPNLILGLLLMIILPNSFSLEAIVILVSSILLYLWVVTSGGLFIGKKLGLIWPASQRVLDVVDRAVEESGITPRAVVEIRWATINAIAYPITQVIGFTDKAVREMTDDELQVICAHELEHLKESRATKVARLFASFMVLPLAAWRPISGTYGWWVFIGVAIGVIIVLNFFTSLSQKLEKKADAEGKKQEKGEGFYAKTLERLHQINLLPAVIHGKRQSHPDLYDRMIDAGIEPDYPRPEPPSKRLGVFWLAMSLIGLVVLIVVGQKSFQAYVNNHPDSIALNESFVPLITQDVNRGMYLFRAAKGAEVSGDIEKAIAYRRVAALTSWHLIRGTYSSKLSIDLATVGECEEAHFWLRQAQWSQEQWGNFAKNEQLEKATALVTKICGPLPPMPQVPLEEMK